MKYLIFAFVLLIGACNAPTPQPSAPAEADAARLFIEKGNSFRQRGMKDSALANYNGALEVLMVENDYARLAALNNILAELYCETAHFDESIGCTNEARRCAQLVGDSVAYYTAVANEGVVYCRLGEHDRAARVLEQAYLHAAQLGSTSLKLKVINHLLVALNKIEDDTSLDYFMAQAEELAKALPPHDVVAMGIAEARINVYYARGNYQAALAEVQLLKAEGKRLVMPPYKLLRVEAACQAALGNPTSAYSIEREAARMESDDVMKVFADYGRRFQAKNEELEAKTQEAEQNKLYLRCAIAAAVLLLVLAVVVVVVLRNRSHRKMQALQSKLDKAQKQIESVDAERGRLAHELHDGVCNDLLGLGLNIRGKQVADDALLHQVEEVRASVRMISHRLMPPTFNYAPLNELLEDCIGRIVKPDTLTISYSPSGDCWTRIPHTTAYELSRIAYEALSESIRRATATSVEVSAALDAATVTLRVTDNGRCPAAPAAENEGESLKSMRERAARIGATLSWQQGEQGAMLEVTAKVDALPESEKE